MRKRHHAAALLLCLASLFLLNACKSASHTVRGHQGTYTDIVKPPSKHYGNEGSNTKIGEALVKEASQWLGTKYAYGGNTKKGVDCSGLVLQVYLKVCGVKLPRSSREQQAYCKQIKKSDLMVGDLVFFATGSNKRTVSHVGLYIGKGEMIHASASKGVIISSLEDSYYTRNYHSSGRVAAIEKYMKPGKSHKKEEENKKKQEETATEESLYDTTVATESAVETVEETGNSAEPPTISPSQVDLNDLIEEKIDSIYSSWMY